MGGGGGGGVAGFSGCPVFLCEIFFIVYYTNRTTFCITYFANMALKSQFWLQGQLEIKNVVEKKSISYSEFVYTVDVILKIKN